jgi:hypothetical protein
MLIGAYFILFLLSQNLGEVTLAEALPWVVAAAALGAVVMVVAALAFGDAQRGGIVAAAFMALFFAYGHVIVALRPLRLPAIVHPVGWGLVLLAAVVVAIRIRGRHPTVTRGLTVLSALFVLVSLTQIVPYELGRKPVEAADRDVVATPSGAVAGRKPDIYYIILDRHANDATIANAFGTSSPLSADLRAAGFTVLDHAYANYLRTHLSLASSLNMSFLDDLTEKYGRETNESGPVFEMLQDNAVGRFLQGQGYTYVHTGSAYGPTDRNRTADQNPRRTNDTDFSRALFDTTVLPVIARRLSNGRTPERDRLYQTAVWQWGELAAVRDIPGPKFVFSHFLLPHPPYIFDTDGTYVDEATERSRSEAENYRRQLLYTDRQVEAVIAPLLALPADRRPIIIIQSDEGPFPPRYTKFGLNLDWTTATSAELEQKFGILDAIYLPDGATFPSPAFTPVNTFRWLFSRYFGADLPLLPDRVFISRFGNHEYDFIDVTDKLRWADELRAPKSVEPLAAP